MALLKIDETELEITKEKTVLEVALENDIEIPHYCYHPALEIAGSCRMCLVQVEGMPKLQVSCNTFVGELPSDRKVEGKYDMVVYTQNDLVKKERKNPTVILNRVLPRARLTDAMIMRLRYAGAKIARSRISSKVIYAETFSVGRGIVDISVTSDTSKEIIKIGNEILRNF